MSTGFYTTASEAATKNGSLDGKVFLITGAYSGIGAETTKALLQSKGQVILAGRSAESMKTFVESLQQEDGCDEALIDADGPVCDLADLATVQAFAKYVQQKYTKLDVLILNAGVMMTPPGVTKQGYEQQVGINCVGHFLLAQTLLPMTVRQVWVSSKAHEMAGGKPFDFDWFQKFSTDQLPNVSSDYDPMFAYQQSKLGNILLAKEFAKRDETGTLETCSLHPGVIDTNLGRHLSAWMRGAFTMMGWVGILSKKTAAQGAATTVTCATLPSIQQGAYYSDCEVTKAAGNATNERDAIRFFDLCMELTKEFQETSIQM